ncbi:MAG: sugar ABC transporter permease [Clostridia bacterium]|nr:sugar ABC transporter permease [Clostridia bacterium]
MRRTSGLQRRTNRKLLLIGGPFVLAFLALYVAPMLMTAGYSLLDNSFAKGFAGLSNYVRVWQNAWFQLALRNTAVLTLLLVGAASALALTLGFLLYRHDRAALPALMVLLLPLFLPSASVTLLWRSAFRTNAFSAPATAYAAVTSLFVWKYAGVGAMLVYIGLKRVPENVLEAASLDGASQICVYARISLPLIRQQLTLMALFFLMYAFRIYKEAYLLFGEYPCDCMYLIQHYMSNHFLKLNFQNVATAAVSLSTLALLCYGAAWLLALRRRNRSEGGRRA